MLAGGRPSRDRRSRIPQLLDVFPQSDPNEAPKTDGYTGPPLEEICSHLSHAMQTQNKPELEKSIEFLNQYIDSQNPCDLQVIMKETTLQHLMWIVNQPDFPIPVRKSALQAYSGLLSEKSGELCELSVALGHLNALGSVYQFNLQELTELIPMCLCTIARHNDACHKKVMGIPKDVMAQLVKLQDEKAEKDVLELLIAMVRRPFDSEEFAEFAMNQFCRALEGQDERQELGMLGVAYMIEFGNPALNVAQHVFEQGHIPALWGSEDNSVIIGMFLAVRNLALANHRFIPNLDWRIVIRWIDPELNLDDPVIRCVVYHALMLLTILLSDYHRANTLVGNDFQLLERINALYPNVSFHLKEQVSICFCKIVQNCWRRKYVTILETGGIEKLAEMLETGDPRISEQALHALREIVRARNVHNNHEQIQELFEAHDIPRIVGDIQHGTNDSLGCLADRLYRDFTRKSESKPNSVWRF